MIYLSGLRDASAGLGVARSLREAFGDLRIVGVDYSSRSPAIHDEVFDDVWIERPWAALPLAAHAGEIRRRLDAGGAWISGCEREARWLGGAVGDHDRLLSPAPRALERLAACAPDLAGRLGLSAAPAISIREEDAKLSAFGRRHGWRLWLRGPSRAATRVDGWRSLERVRAHLAEAWSGAGLLLQAEIPGTRESIVFVAHRGRTLGARHLRLSPTGAGGATLGGGVTELRGVLPGVAARLEAELAAAAWTGGGELVLVRSADDAVWLIECRPLFPPWVHGATLAGANLPAALLATATGRTPAPAADRGTGFVRVTVDIPLRPGHPLPAPAASAGGVVRAGGFLSGLPEPGLRAAGPAPAGAREDPLDPVEPLRTILAGLRGAEHTPHAHRTDPAARWELIAARVRAAARACRVEIAYSIKTDPDAGLLAAARAHGFLAEAITAAEMRWALSTGFAGEEIVLNGPAKRWPPSPAPIRTFATFADSLGELRELAGLARSGALSAGYLGPRLRPPSVASRFGLELGDFTTFSGLLDVLASLPQSQALGVHFHWASSEAGHETWFDTVAALVDWARALQDLTGRAVRCLDLGGGWHPDDFDTVLLARLGGLVAGCRAELDGLEVIVLEPGRALVQSLAVVETTVLEVRERGGAREIVVDASLAEVPRAGVYPHEILSRIGGTWGRWGRGPDRLVGRLCMEDDVLRMSVGAPEEVRAGTRVLIADAGAYDRSMAYRFGRG